MHMHFEPLSLADDADDRVARYGPAASRQLYRDALAATDQDGAGRFRLDDVGAAGFHVLGLRQAARDDYRQALAEADVDEDVAAGAHAAVAQEALPGEIADLADRQAVGSQRLVEQPLAQRRGLLLLHVLQEVADLRACLAGAGVR